MYAAARARPDIDVHAAVENAGSMLDKFRLAMARALGITTRRAGAEDAGHEPSDLGGPLDYAPAIATREFSE